jgi:hypothetical protein
VDQRGKPKEAEPKATVKPEPKAKPERPLTPQEQEEERKNRK